MDTCFNPFFLNGKTILVTGASSGIGRATALLCSQMGARVVITGRNEARLQETLGSLSGEGNLRIAADLTDERSRTRLVEDTPALDGIVHCAGIGHRKLCKAINAEDIATVMNANFNAAVLLQACLLAKKKVNKGSSIVFVSSRTAEIPTVANSLYSASKGALKSYAKCLSLELAPRAVRVNCICPAMVWTPLVLNEGVTEEDLQAEQTKYPLKRYGKPEDIANLAVFLLSDASSWMTGSCIDITGGSIEL
ncbi:MAG: SDR family oxidoreductase [Bacteroidales bacterium]|nr:SDR family oxidoreductase [Bacteroidales bacterium]